jgi:hypothetical protein
MDSGESSFSESVILKETGHLFEAHFLYGEGCQGIGLILIMRKIDEAISEFIRWQVHPSTQIPVTIGQGNLVVT